MSALESLDQAVTIAAISAEDRGTGGTDVASTSGFDGPVLVDAGARLMQAYGADFGSVLFVDPSGVLRFHKPGSKFKRPRADLVVHALAALIERAEEPEALAETTEELGSSSSSARARAAARLAELEAVEALDALVRALAQDESDAVREAAASALGVLRDPRAIEALAAALADEERDVRLAAARALVSFGDDYEAYPGSSWRHEYTHAESRELTARADVLVPAAERLLEDRSKDARRLGARLLWRARHESAKPRLLALTEDRDEAVRYAALGGLEPWREEPAVQAAAKRLRGDRSSDVRAMAQYVEEGPVGKIRE